jgi:hypothetical protein
VAGAGGRLSYSSAAGESGRRPQRRFSVARLKPVSSHSVSSGTPAARAAMIRSHAVSVAFRDSPAALIAVWPPLALLLIVELISRIPVHSRSLAAARIIATAVIAGIAAWVSYWHMVGVAARYGETGAAPYLIPVSVDGLIVVASICLVELGGRIRISDTSPNRTLATRFDYAAPIGPLPEPQRLQSLKAASVAASEKRRRVRHYSLIRRGQVTHPKTRVITVQEPRQDPRATHEIDLVVSAIKGAQPGLGQRRIAHLAGTSDSTVRRALRHSAADGPTHSGGRISGLESASA